MQPETHGTGTQKRGTQRGLRGRGDCRGVKIKLFYNLIVKVSGCIKFQFIPMPKRSAKEVEAVEPEEKGFDKEQNIVSGLRFEEEIRKLDTEREREKNQLQKVRFRAASVNFW